MAFLQRYSGILLDWSNMGIMMGLTFSVIILLRPVTNRLMRPGYRIFLWMVGWISWIGWGYAQLGRIKFLPVTFRQLIVPRTTDYGDAPAFLPEVLEAGVETSVILPGGAEILFTPGQVTVALAALAGCVAFIFLIWWIFAGEYRFLKRYREGRWLTREELKELGVETGIYFVAVKLCDDLPTSFVTTGRFTGAEYGTNYAIFLQSELPKQRQKLILQHELQHIYAHHIGLKSYMTLALVLFWWNPVVWLAYRLTCRDMELHCDERVLRTLNEGERREYARMLVDLGSGKFLWNTAASFGECDTALRVKHAVGWKKAADVVDAMGFLLALAMALFLFTGAGDWTVPAYRVEENLVAKEQSWDGDNTVWREYAQGPQVIRDMREFANRPSLDPFSFYELEEGEVILYSTMGEWLRFRFEQDTGGLWCPVEWEYLPGKEPEVEGLEFIAPWTRQR